MQPLRQCQGRMQAEGITKTYHVGAKMIPVLNDVSITAAAGEFVAVLGPSGCGKSTLLEIICGLQVPQAGVVLIDGVPVNTPGQVGYMPQRSALLPWRSIIDNVTIGLTLHGTDRRSARARANEYMELFGLAGFETSYPHALSGGMQQRAALLRTYLSGRAILALDEPFGALDAIPRREMQEWLAEVHRTLGVTIVMVTHDIDEALLLADQIYVLTGRPAQVNRTMQIALPKPRTVVSSTFNDYKADVLAALSGSAVRH